MVVLVSLKTLNKKTKNMNKYTIKTNLLLSKKKRNDLLFVYN